MSRVALWFAASFLAGAIVAALYPLYDRQPLIVEADNRDLLVGMATGQAVQLTAMAPTAAPHKTSTPTRTPQPPTPTPFPTYSGAASPGLFVVPKWTEVPPPTPMTVEAIILPCVTVTPDKYADTYCEVE